MPIQSIIAQPSQNSLFAAYRPVILLVQATATNGTAKPPVVYCDIYFGGIYYKSLSKTMHNTLTDTNSEWRFDIQDAAQEYLKKYIASNGGSSIVEVSSILVKAQCKFRSSGYDASGFILPEGVVPIQGTGSKEPVAGGGTSSNEFFIINSTLQHQDNQSLADHLAAFKSGTWNSNCFPLTHRPDGYIVMIKDSDYFPALIDSALCIDNLSLKYRLVGQRSWRQKSVSMAGTCNAVISEISVVQIGGTRNAEISWPAAEGANSYVYRTDGGVYLPTDQNSITINDFTISDHTVEVAAVCQCNQGAPLSKAFTIQDPATFVCTSAAVGATVSQTGEGSASVSWGISGAAGPSRIRLDGGPWFNNVFTPYDFNNLSEGSHSVEIQPVCGNGVPGTSAVVNFSIQGMPSITKINETSTGPGGIRTQVFKIGPSVWAGNRFHLIIYSHAIDVIALAGDTPSSIATKLKNAINGTTTTQWNDAASAPAVGTPGFPPTATSSGDQLTIQMNYQNSFSYSASLT